MAASSSVFLATTNPSYSVTKPSSAPADGRKPATNNGGRDDELRNVSAAEVDGYDDGVKSVGADGYHDDGERDGAVAGLDE